jgi:WS/DGAT/MGAT family acyltransferase
MAYAHYDRLSALDALFLVLEDEDVHMHVGAVGIFELGPLRHPDGGLDMQRIRSLAAPLLARSRRFRQRLEHVPLVGHPVWVDDARFNLDYHLRHTALPEPGDERKLKRLAGRIVSQKLDFHKPLWEMWFVEGLEGDRFAIIAKVHHAMVDGISGVDLLALLMWPEAEASVREAEAEGSLPRPWLPRPTPSGLRLLAEEAGRRAALPLGILRAGREALAHPSASLDAAREAIVALSEVLGAGLASPASRTPLNPELGPHRRFDWLRMDLGAVKEVKNALGGTVNDVALATVSGAVRAFLEGRGVDADALDFRALLPVNIRSDAERGRLGNRVANLVARLPVHEADRRGRHERVLETTRRLKASHQVHGGELLERIGDWTAKELVAAMVRLAAERLAFNLVVTNVPGPQFPAYLLGARMLEIYPLVPLFENQGAGIALFSYDGGLFWGFNADWDSMPDLHDLVSIVENEFEALRKLAHDGAPCPTGPTSD